MSQSYQTSFFVTLALIFLAPLFFIPGGALYLASAKSAFFSVGLVIVTLTFFFDIWRQGSLKISKNYLLVVAALLPVVYLLSAILATPSSLSLIGYNFEVSTFGFILLGSSGLLLASFIFSESSRLLQALVTLFGSLSVLAVFMLVKILSGGNWLVLGNFSGNMGNPLGNWTDLGIIFGLLSVFAALVIGMIPMKRSVKLVLWGVFVLATALLVIINFLPALWITLVASILLFLFFSRVERHYLFSKNDLGESSQTIRYFLSRNTFLPLLLVVVSLLFIINPIVSGERRLGEVVSEKLNIQNSDVRPNLSATLSISKAVLSQGAFLGSGPNTFGYDWLVFKSVNVNTTPFWAVAFPFGLSFISTQVATTGLFGTVLWLVFFVLLILLGVRTLGRIPESRATRFILISSLFIAFFLWAASFLYTPSPVVLMLTFIFTGIFLAASREAGIISTRIIDLKTSGYNKSITLTVLLLLTLGALYIGKVGVTRTVAAYHFKQASDLANTEGASVQVVESHLDKAIKFAPIDIYYRALSRLNFLKAQAAASATTGTPEENGANFWQALSKSREAAQLAVAANPASYEAWASLGFIHASLVPAPLQVEGAYENAQFAFSEAYKRNPTNPELPLLLASLELSNNNVDAARSYLRNSIALKEDYADAYLMLAQLESQQNNIPEAIASAEKLLSLVPNNPGLYFEVGVLKYSSGNYLGAVESLLRAIAITPEYANARYYLALSYSKLGRASEARTELEVLLKTNPDNAEVKGFLQELDKKN